MAAAMAIAALAMVLATPRAEAASTWSEVKCQRYGAAWDTLIARRGTTGLGPAFLERHAAFIASGCSTAPDVCPRSPAELDVANALVIAAMNGGAASTFLPFRCAK